MEKDTNTNKDKEININNKKYKYISLKDVFVVDDRSKKKYIDIREHSYYISLEKQDSIMYSNYVNQKRRQREKDTGTWSGFKQLYDNIKKNGFEFKNHEAIILKKIDDKYCCLHGRHRICMMKQLYGDNVILTLKNNKICAIEVKK
jgi:hypothetical protein